MFRFIRRRKQLKKIKKVKEGDGHLLKPYRFWHILTRSVFYLKLKGEQDEKLIYAINYSYWADDYEVDLYRDGKHVASSKLPATFPVYDGVIEMAIGSYGFSRAHYVPNHGESYPLLPDRQSVRGLRLRFHKRFKKISTVIGIIAALTLLASVFLSLPQLIEYLSEIPWIKENIGTFVSPVSLPGWANVTLITAGILAATERALMLRSHWLIDMETSYWDH
ncbi:hypothetical protein DH09_18980 [Bacillaceae bacterium JMAK1]|nr:hypothetical protein DH09_18980 [Bacillaceae bacterium JMAK1]